MNAKCRLVGSRFVEFCGAMSDVIQGGPTGCEGEPKGLAYSFGWLDDEDPGPRPLGVVYRARANAQGLVLNVCPWCREDLRWWLPEKERRIVSAVELAAAHGFEPHGKSPEQAMAGIAGADTNARKGEP